MSPNDAQQFFDKNGLKLVLAQFVDIHGVAKAKSVPVSHFSDITGNGAGFAGFAISGMGIDPHGPDFMARGDAKTLSVLPWQPGYARIVCEGYIKGEPWHHDTRYVLRQQMARLAERGLTFYTGLEPEFSLLKRTAGGGVAPFDDSDVLAKPCYDYKGLTRAAEFLEKLVADLQGAGLDIFQIDHEDANGQFEVNYTFADGLSSCDNYVLFKMAASEIANKMGLVCSFMPKPFADRPGNGMHMHMSIGDGKRNLFEDKSDVRGLDLSRLAYQFLAGVLKHAPALTALCAPTVNSYKRLVVSHSLTGATWAPAYISYGDNNRSALVRVPKGRLELRLPDGACNPYLATAAVIAAGLDGIENDLDPGEPHNNNLYLLSKAELADRGIDILPQNLSLAVDALEKDGVIRSALGPVIDTFVDLKRTEWTEYMRHVSEWELKRYVEFF
jgi:glutamine synthetase